MSCGVGSRHGLDPALLWLWRRLAAIAPIRPLAWELPHAMGATLKKKKKKKFYNVIFCYHKSMLFVQLVLLYIRKIQRIFFLMLGFFYTFIYPIHSHRFIGLGLYQHKFLKFISFNYYSSVLLGLLLNSFM